MRSVHVCSLPSLASRPFTDPATSPAAGSKTPGTCDACGGGQVHVPMGIPVDAPSSEEPPSVVQVGESDVGPHPDSALLSDAASLPLGVPLPTSPPVNTTSSPASVMTLAQLVAMGEDIGDWDSYRKFTPEVLFQTAQKLLLKGEAFMALLAPVHHPTHNPLHPTPLHQAML